MKNLCADNSHRLGLALNGENIVPHAVRDELSVYIADGNVSWEEKARKLRKAHLRLVDRTHQAMAALHSVYAAHSHTLILHTC